MARKRSAIRHRLEYAPVWLLANVIRWMPRPLAHWTGIGLGLLVHGLHARLRHVGLRNLDLAFPEKSRKEKQKIVREVFAGLGRQLAEFCLFPRYTRDNVGRIAGYEGFHNFAAAQARGKGVILLTAHFSGWETSAFAHSLYGHPMNVVVRPLDNPYLDAMVSRYRAMHGNTIVSKQEYARGLLKLLKGGETVGILMDTNMTPPQGAFVDFFGVPACTATGVARVALHTGAAVVPGFCIWDRELLRYKICFEPAVNLVQTGNAEADAIINTAAFNKVIESYARRYPDQWLWVHRRWKTRPEGQPSLY
jgi:Kdo2-lipid IVA lauroyltransferase/acyltransferase